MVANTISYPLELRCLDLNTEEAAVVTKYQLQPPQQGQRTLQQPKDLLDVKASSPATRNVAGCMLVASPRTPPLAAYQLAAVDLLILTVNAKIEECCASCG